MKEKRSELENEQQKRLIQRLLKTVATTDPDLYYRSSNEIARAIQDYANVPTSLNQTERELFKPLSLKDITLLLSYN